MATTFRDYLFAQQEVKQGKTKDVASLRPTLYIGLGGFGCTVVRRLKSEVEDLVPKHAQGFAFLGMDTHPRDRNDVLTQNEYLPLSIGISPNDAAKRYPEVLDWYLKVLGSYRARNIQAGADKTKAVGRLAFRHPSTFQSFFERLSSAEDRLSRFRKDFALGTPTKLYVISTLAGGTGAGCLLDVLFSVGKFFREASGAEFPYQAILVTPDVLKGEAPAGHIPDFSANTYATLKEIHNFFVSDAELVLDYDQGKFRRVKLDRTLLPDPFHLIGDRNEAGTSVVSRIEELADVVVSYLLSEIQTPMEEQSGQPKVQDKENSYSDAFGMGGAPRDFSSFGVVRTGLPLDVVERLFTLRLIHATLAAELVESPDIPDRVSVWMDENHLKEAGVDQLQDRIKQEAGREALRVALDAKGKILQPGFKYTRLVEDCTRYLKSMEKALEQDRKNLLVERAKAASKDGVDKLRKTFEDLLKQRNLRDALSFAQTLEETIKVHQTALKQESTDAGKLLDRRQKEAQASIQGIGNSAQGFFGRRGRVENAVSDFDAKLHSLLQGQLDVWIKDEADQVYSGLLADCKKLKDQWSPVLKALNGHLENSKSSASSHELLIDQMADIGRRGPGNRFSLLDSRQVAQLYEQIVKDEQTAAIGRIRQTWLEQGKMKDTKTDSEEWIRSVSPSIAQGELREKLKDVTFISVLESFYGEESAKRKLFDSLQSLSSPLFWLDQNLKEPNYDSYWIIAVHPGQKAEFLDRYDRFLPGQGKVTAFSDSPCEVTLYQLKFGYTIASYQGLASYESDYRRLQEEYANGKMEKRRVKPVHSWEGAEEWPDLIPRPEAEEAVKWFILGRAFSFCFPSSGAASPDDGKNVSFLHARGSNYYLHVSEDKKPERVGQGLAEALRNFEERADWQQILRKRIEAKIAEVGDQAVREKLESSYLPVIEAEIDTAEKAPDPQQKERAKILRKLLTSLRKFTQEELRTSKV